MTSTTTANVISERLRDDVNQNVPTKKRYSRLTKYEIKEYIITKQTIQSSKCLLYNIIVGINQWIPTYTTGVQCQKGCREGGPIIGFAISLKCFTTQIHLRHITYYADKDDPIFVRFKRCREPKRWKTLFKTFKSFWVTILH